MNALKNFKLVAISLLIAGALAACDKKPGPAESVGKQIDQTAAEAGKKMGEAVNKVEEKISVQSAKAEVAMDDTEITTKVKASIFAEPGLKTLQISVGTVKGVVTLTGAIDSQANINKAVSLAAAVSGVKTVENKLVLAK